jgi:prophage regulatory protein
MRKILSPTTTRATVGEPDRKTIYNWVRKGLFPEPVQIGPNKIGWYEDEIQKWLESRPRGFMPVRPELKKAADRKAADRKAA